MADKRPSMAERHKRLLSLGPEVTYGIKLGEKCSFYAWKNIVRTENKIVL